MNSACNSCCKSGRAVADIYTGFFFRLFVLLHMHSHVDFNEEPLETSQFQMESETSTTTMTQSRIPRPSNAPPDEGNDKRTSKIPLESMYTYMKCFIIFSYTVFP